MPIDPETEKHLKDLGASLANLQAELLELRKHPSANAAQIELLKNELHDVKVSISKAGGSAPTKGFFEAVFEGFRD